ncbi:biotin--[acetyl-CoA-carboxylase] ligase [Stackebrandtia soli]|uniref:biotin--[acetyl-CoA-carboxylase] ligase n=1 Tax=Stackebrandtia soli TaxID=1892856 RepID=UPI0039EA7C0C
MHRPALDTTELARHVDESSLWTSIEVVSEVGSTNTALAARARVGAPEGVVLTTEHQTHGKGRVDRSWTSPPRAGIAVSVLLRPKVPQSTWSWIPLLAGVAAADAVRRFSGVETALKWPNDVLAGPERRKCAGILAEIADGGVVLGLGVNVDLSRAELPRDDTTSIALETSGALDRTGLLAAILTDLERWYRAWLDAGGDPIAANLASAYRERSHTLGKQVVVWLPDGSSVRGRAVAVDADGRLCVDNEHGRTAVAAGDVTHVRLG